MSEAEIIAESLFLYASSIQRHPDIFEDLEMEWNRITIIDKMFGLFRAFELEYH